MNSNTLSAITVVALIAALAIGLIVYFVTEFDVLIILWVTLTVFGMALGYIALMSQMMAQKKSGKSEPLTPFFNKLIVADVILLAGMLGVVYTVFEFDPIFLITAYLVFLALAIIAAVWLNIIRVKKKEGKK